MHGYALVFSIVSRQSFEMIQQVNDALLNTLGDAPDVPRVLVGSMKDLAHQRQVSMQVRLIRSIPALCVDTCCSLGALSHCLSELTLTYTLQTTGRREISPFVGCPVPRVLEQNGGKRGRCLSYNSEGNRKRRRPSGGIGRERLYNFVATVSCDTVCIYPFSSTASFRGATCS